MIFIADTCTIRYPVRNPREVNTLFNTPPPLPLPLQGNSSAMEAAEPHRVLSAIDMGTNSFKLLLCSTQNHPFNFTPILRLSCPVVLGSRRNSNPNLPIASMDRSISALRYFSLLSSVHATRLVATSAIRNAPNRADLFSRIRSELGFEVEVLSGRDEARLIYLGIRNFPPLYKKIGSRSVLAVDIGGGSTEFVIGLDSEILYSISLDLGHVTLTESFGNAKLDEMRKYIRTVLDGSGLVEKVRELGFEIAVGSSGTVRSIGKVLSRSNFGEAELGRLVDKIRCSFESGLGIKGLRELGFSSRRSEFVAAGAVLLMEIFDVLGIEEMEVSGYGLAEGVIAEMMMMNETSLNISMNSLDLNVRLDWSANERWRSVVGLAERFDGENRMKLVVQLVRIAKDIFDGIRKCETSVCLDHKDFEYIEAAILLHNIGRVTGKKGYHKTSYQIIKNGGVLHGYSSEEIELIALLARFHRKKFPKCQHASLKEFRMKMKEKFRVLCIIVRLSLRLHQCQCMVYQGLMLVHTPEGFRLELKGIKKWLEDPSASQLTSAATVEEELGQELKYFEEVFQQKISVMIL